MESIDNKAYIKYNKTYIDFNMLNINDIESISNTESTRGKWNSIVLVTGGDGLLQIDFDEFIALNGKVFFIEKYRVWNWVRQNNLQGIMVQFTDSFYNHIYTGNLKLKSDQTLIGEIPPFIKIKPGDKTEWMFLLDIIQKEYTDAGRNSREIICLTLKIIILMYRRNSQSGSEVFESGHKKNLLNEFRKLVNSRFYSLKTAKDYARELNITPNYLNALCQEYFLKTVSEIIQERVILEAKRLLMHTSYSISEIGYNLGFKDNSYFGRYFKKAVGMTPKEFRVSFFTSKSLNHNK